MSRFDLHHCRDPRDRIFSLLAVSSDSTQLRITPDYSKWPEELFQYVSISLFHSEANLRPLTFACKTVDFSDLTRPSWAIGSPWPAHLQPIFISHRFFRPHPRLNLRPPPRFHSHENNTVLTLKGCIVDHISLVTSPLYQPISITLITLGASYTEFISQLAGNLMEVLFDIGISIAHAAALCRALVTYPVWEPTQGPGSITEATYHF
jgi:hypothetical protein